MSSVTVGDGELVRRCRCGEPGAWDELVERFAAYVHAIVVQGFRLGPADAEDVFQDVFAKVYEHLGRLRDDDAIRPWLAQLTRRLAVDRLRAARREAEPASDGAEQAEPDAALARIEDALAVRAAMAALPEACREVLDRFFASDESYATIADGLGIPTGTVASRISRCLARLRAALGDEGRNDGVRPS